MFIFYFVYRKHQVLLICNEKKNLCCQFDDTIEVDFLLGINIWGLHSEQAHSQGGGGGAVGAVAPQNAQKKEGREREKKKENKVACMHVKLPPFNHFQSKIKYKFVLYEENTGHMHQIAPLTTSKCKKLSLWEGGHPPPTPFAPSHVIFTAPPQIKSWLRHWFWMG